MANGRRLLEITLLLILILVNFLDFFEILPGDLDFFKKIFSWLALAHVIFHASLTKQFYGEPHSGYDLWILVAYFLMVSKNIILFARTALEESHYTESFFEFIISNAAIIESTTFVGGAIILLALSLCFGRFEIKEPSLMNVIHERSGGGIGRFLNRFIVSFVLLMSFFVIIFNLMMEWLAMAVDASLLVVAFFFYGFTLFRDHHKKLNPDSFLHSVGQVGEQFYEKFLELLHSKERVYLALSGMLVLHLLTDIGVFLIPFLIGIHDVLYLGHEELYPSLFGFIQQAFSSSSFLDSISLTLVIILNFAGMLSVLFLPAFVWYKLFCQKGFKVNRAVLGILYAAITASILSPLFRVEPLRYLSIVGVGIHPDSIIGLPPGITALLALLCGIWIYIKSNNPLFKEKILAIGIIILQIFFAWYSSLFAFSLFTYYTAIIPVLYGQGLFFIGFLTSLIFVIHTAFFIAGFILFILETWKEYQYIE